MRSMRRIRSQASARSATVTEMQAALMALDKKLDRIVIEALTPTPLSQVLTHYTQNFDTVVEILRSRELWATDCMKARGGEQDLEVVTPRVKEVLEDLVKEYPDQWITKALNEVREDYDKKKLSEQVRIFVACLTQDSDNFQMWESEFGARGSGAAVQFNMLKETAFEDPDSES